MNFKAFGIGCTVAFLFWSTLFFVLGLFHPLRSQTTEWEPKLCRQVQVGALVVDECIPDRRRPR